MNLYENFSKEKLNDIISNSLTFREAVTKMGYPQNAQSKKILNEIQNRYNISISHLHATAKDLRNQSFGKLTVIEMDKERVGSSHQIYWKCKCECGNIKSVRGTDLTAGKVRSCGCIVGNFIPIKIGEKFGKLTVLETFKDKDNNSLVKCQCECGNMCIKARRNIISGHTQSCGCLVSKGENKIEKILQDLDIKYEKQKKFEDLIGKLRPLPFDFYLPDYNICIEYQGEQHYKPMRFTNSQEKFKERQINDNKKRQYCKANNIILIEIPYWDFDKLDKDYLLSKF